MINRFHASRHVLEFELPQVCAQNEPHEAARSGPLPRIYMHVTMRFPRFMRYPQREGYGLAQGPIHGLSTPHHAHSLPEGEGTLGACDRRA
jgi:hypothetical protein